MREIPEGCRFCVRWQQQRHGDVSCWVFSDSLNHLLRDFVRDRLQGSAVHIRDIVCGPRGPRSQCRWGWCCWQGRREGQVVAIITRDGRLSDSSTLAPARAREGLVGGRAGLPFDCGLISVTVFAKSLIASITRGSPNKAFSVAPMSASVFFEFPSASVCLSSASSTRLKHLKRPPS